MNTKQIKSAEKIHPLYNNLFASPSAEQMTKIEKNHKREEEYMDTIYSYRKEHGTDMTLDECEKLYAQLKVKYA